MPDSKRPSNEQSPARLPLKSVGQAANRKRLAESRRASLDGAEGRHVARSGKRKAIDVAGLGVEISYGEAENPYFTRAHRESATNPRKIPVARNSNESPLVLMMTRGVIDERQAMAGHRFRAMVERVQASAISPSFVRERVDGGGQSDPFSLNRLAAAQRLTAVADALGDTDFRILRMVCGEGISINELARRNRVRASSARAALTGALDRLAEHWGLGKRRDG